MLPAALLVLVAAADAAPPASSPPAVQEGLEEERYVDDRPRAVQLQTGVDIGGRLGVSAGNVLLVPFIVPGPGAYVSVDGRVLLFNTGFIDVEGGLSFGVNEQGDPTSVAGYKLRGGAGLRFQPIEIFRIEVDAHAGVTSLALIPTPRLGLGVDAQLRLPIGGNVTFDVDSGVDLDFLVIVPAPGGKGQAGVTWRPGPFVGGIYLGVDGDAVIALLANTISGSVYAQARFAIVL